jgi:hypothetical protein
MKARTERGRRGRRLRFTLVEMLIVLVIMLILAAMLLPMLAMAKAKAKFTRWYAFNRNASNDPYCMVNFNFQEGQGDVLGNTALGADIERFVAKDYQGYLRRYGGGAHQFKWIRSGGRWGRYKHALQFNGTNTYVNIPGSEGVNFTPDDDFTVMTWVKFDKLGLGDCPFSKSLWGTAQDAAAQFDLYSNPFSGSFGQGTFDVDVFTTCASWTDTDVDFEKKGWVHLALRYEADEPNPVNGDVNGRVMTFINGQPLGPYIETTEENPNTGTATGWKPCSDLNVPLVLGAAGCYRKYWSPSTYNKDQVGVLENEWMLRFFFKGLMDEFLVFKRALSDAEVLGHYEMGRE